MAKDKRFKSTFLALRSPGRCTDWNPPLIGPASRLRQNLYLVYIFFKGIQAYKLSECFFLH